MFFELGTMLFLQSKVQYMLKIVRVLAVVASCWTLLAQDSGRYGVRLGSREVVLEPGVASTGQKVLSGTESRKGTRHLILQFFDTPDAEAKADLVLRGVRLLEPVGVSAYYAALDIEGGFAKQVAAGSTPGVRAVYLPSAEDKMADALLAGLPAYTVVENSEGRMVEVLVRFHSDVALSAVEQFARSLGAQILQKSEFFKRVTVRLAASDLKRLAGEDWVKLVDTPTPTPVTHDNAISAELFGSTIAPVSGLNLTGKGVNVGVWDGGQISQHRDFGTRVTLVDLSFDSTHATHVAGTLASGGISNARAKGIAPEANLFSWDFDGDFAEEMLRGVDNHRVTISSNSWGFGVFEQVGTCHYYGRYDTSANDFDKLVRDKGLSIVVSAANERDQIQCGIDGRSGFNTITAPGTAKNVITVGAIDKDRVMSEFSSYGPTKDGRLKPEITGLGVSVYSTTPRNLYGTLSGTSMSAPAISGLLALATERYRSWIGGEPTPALLKALLLNTATDLGNRGPDYAYGFGLPNAAELFRSLDDRQFRDGRIEGGTQEYSFNVAGGTPALRVMLAYSDAPSDAFAGRTLVNDLDLMLVSPSGKETLPLTLDPLNPGANAAPGANPRDPVEQAVVENPEAGEWKVIVRARSVPAGEQAYVVAWSFGANPMPPCSMSIAPASALTVGPKAGVFAFHTTTPNHCADWKPDTGVDWLKSSVTDPVKGGAPFKLSWTEHSAPARRTAEVKVGDKLIKFTQAGPCVTKPIKSGETVKESLTSEDCTDGGYFVKQYTFTAKLGQLGKIEMKSNQIDAYLVLLGPGDTYLTEDDDSGEGFNSLIEGNLPSEGTYTIYATSAFRGEVGEFELTLTLTDDPERPAPPVTELRGCPASVEGELTRDDSRSGRRGDPFPTDFYRFPARIGQQIVIDIPEANFDTVLYLISPTGDVVAVNDDSPESSRSRINTLVLESGNFEIQVGGFSPQALGTYKMSVNGCSAPPE